MKRNHVSSPSKETAMMNHPLTLAITTLVVESGEVLGQGGRGTVFEAGKFSLPPRRRATTRWNTA